MDLSPHPIMDLPPRPIMDLSPRPFRDIPFCRFTPLPPRFPNIPLSLPLSSLLRVEKENIHGPLLELNLLAVGNPRFCCLQFDIGTTGLGDDF
jgi:hypothetical protein